MGYEYLCCKIQIKIPTKIKSAFWKRLKKYGNICTFYVKSINFIKTSCVAKFICARNHKFTELGNYGVNTLSNSRYFTYLFQCVLEFA